MADTTQSEGGGGFHHTDNRGLRGSSQRRGDYERRCVTGVFIGLYDLRLSLGVPGGSDGREQAFVDAMERICVVGKKLAKPAVHNRRSGKMTFPTWQGLFRGLYSVFDYYIGALIKCWLRLQAHKHETNYKSRDMDHLWHRPFSFQLVMAHSRHQTGAQCSFRRGSGHLTSPADMFPGLACHVSWGVNNWDREGFGEPPQQNMRLLSENGEEYLLF